MLVCLTFPKKVIQGKTKNLIKNENFFSGVWFRRSKKPNTYLCGLNNSAENEPSDLNFRNIDYSYFENQIKPVLVHRVPSFANLKVMEHIFLHCI
jgi:hypothetical protein